MGNKVACYIRVSTQEQNLHGISLDAQRDKLKVYADNHDLNIVAWYEDAGVSGRKLIKNRPALQNMLKDAQAGKFERILFIKLDRFFRSVAEYHECMKLLASVTWTATEEKYDLTTANGRAFVNMKLTIAELEADQTGERIKLVNDYKIKNGGVVVGSKSMSLGFMVKDKKVVHDPEYEDIVIDAINHFLKTNSKRGTARYLQEKYKKNINYRRITTLFKDTKLYGAYRDNPNYCEPYISKETFDKIQNILKKNIKRPPSGRVYLFTGLMQCPLCGRILASNCSTVNGKTYISYKCTKHMQNFNCDFSKVVNEKRIEDYLLNNFDRYVTSTITKIQITDNIKDEDTEKITKTIDSIKKEMKNTTLAFTKGRLTEPEYDKLYEDLETRLHTLYGSFKPSKERNVKMYEDIVKSGWKTIYESLEPINKRTFWRKYINTIVLDPSGNIIDVDLL